MTIDFSATYATSMAAPVAQQVITSMSIIMGRQCGDEGQRRIARLADNTRYFRSALHRRGFILYGNSNSPVVPLLLFLPAKIAAFSREMLKKNIGRSSLYMRRRCIQLIQPYSVTTHSLFSIWNRSGRSWFSSDTHHWISCALLPFRIPHSRDDWRRRRGHRRSRD